MTSIAATKQTQNQEKIQRFLLMRIVAYLNDPDGNNSIDNGDKWVLNKNINFDYSSCYDDVNSHIDMNLLHMPLPMSTTCMHIEE